MFDRFLSLDPIVQALVATAGTWAATAVGAAGVLFFRAAPQRLLDGALGFAAGVMVAASSWSLLAPAMETGGLGVAVLGLLIGGAALYGLDKALPHLHARLLPRRVQEGPIVAWRSTVLLILAITIHNFPEGVAVGVAFGAQTPGAATALAIGIGLQNMPEGLAVSLPLRREGVGRWKAFLLGQASALVEPAGGVLGAYLVVTARALLPYGLAFAAGAMLFVVIEELLPDAVKREHTDVVTLGFLGGFTLMMALDNLLG
ncbi:MAG TPA: ZIP family metal transporter [Longimicrobiales bacterium]